MVVPAWSSNKRNTAKVEDANAKFQFYPSLTKKSKVNNEK